jgi:hypothetical protein
MGFLDRVINNAVSGVTYGVTSAVGMAVGGALSQAANRVADEAVDGVVNDMKIAKEKKNMALREQQKVNDLPPICPHCGAATAGKLVCDYCDCKIVE